MATLVSRLRQRTENPEFRQRLSLAGPFKPDSRLYLILAARWLLPRAAWFAPFVRASSLCLYATPGGERTLIKELELQHTERGANVTLWITPRADFYRYPIHLPNGITTTSLVQTYLDLQAGGERGREAAGQLLTHKLKPLWNECKSANP